MNRKPIPFLLIALCTLLRSFGQDSIVHRVILIGDAGEIGGAQQAVIPNAVAQILPGRTTVLFLGDNIYPKGMGLPGTPGEKTGQDILRAQFGPFRSAGAPVYFIPGNHDWDRMGPLGLEKIVAQNNFIEKQNDPELSFVPHDGCPDPFEIALGPQLSILVFDSEWWLFPFDRINESADCRCRTKEDVTDRLTDLMYRNRFKHILLASHHPFQSHGTHGGYFSWKDHLFPLTAAAANLYIPLPGLGSLYPLLRRLFTSPEDLRHPLYRGMIRSVDATLVPAPNVVHVAGHEHGLQFIKGSQVQVVSGAGAKHNYVGKGKTSLYGRTVAGFVTVDLMTDSALRFGYHTADKGKEAEPFFTRLTYVDPRAREDSAYKAIPGDSVLARAHPGFDRRGRFHRFFFGENYRKEWAAETRLPVIRLSEFAGGLKPLSRGGGKQTHSLRLEDSTGREWALRSVEKYPEIILPEEVRQTFAADLVTDAMSAQHPYSALVVPPIAEAAHIPHAEPVIGIVSPDPRLGIYAPVFNNTVCLLELREPLGKSDNTGKMRAAVRADNDNTVDQEAFLKARVLDLLLADWDRHTDQWRWLPGTKKKNKFYVPVPRDRDQVFRMRQGFFPVIASAPFIAPFFQGFRPRIVSAATLFFSSTELSQEWLNRVGYGQWMKITRDFQTAVTDSVLRTAIDRLPESSRKLRGDRLLQILMARRNDLPRAMAAYYRFLNKKAPVILSDRNEFVRIGRDSANGLHLEAFKLSKSGEQKVQLVDRYYDAKTTRELRVFLGKGNDSISISNAGSPIRIRVVGGTGEKKYFAGADGRRIIVYDGTKNASFSGNDRIFSKHLSDDSANTAVDPGNLFNVAFPMLDIGYNLDDGFLLGAGIRYTHQRFRERPYGSVEQFSIGHSFSTSAYRIRYKGEWVHALGKADLLVSASALAPENTQNFYGAGNETSFRKFDGYQRFYRARFSLYSVDPAVRWGTKKKNSFSIGPAFQYYRYDSADNHDRFIEIGKVGSYDSNTLRDDRLHAGVSAGYLIDKRNNSLLPSWGYSVRIGLKGMVGLNDHSKSFAQLGTEIALFKQLDAGARLVISDRLGGTLTAGRPAFYQLTYLGGQGNLLGYRQFRFAGRHEVFNNFELRLKIADIASYVAPGQFGMIGLFGIGRVWAQGENSDKWHNGAGGGFYFAPGGLAVIRLVAGYSSEGWYPYFSVGLRF